jgi:hypothetical protein
MEALEHSALSTYLRASEWAYPLVNTLHILGIALLVGPILVLDWRVLRQHADPPLSALARLLLPAARVGFVLAVAAGLLLFTARPLDYAFHALFQVKMGCILLALLNIAALHRSAAWRTAIAHNRVNWRVLLACGLSVAFWLAVLMLGRLVGYR